jgi:uncharacterized membrane protein
LHGFLDIGGSFTTIDVPGGTATIAAGINDNGYIVGTFQGATGSRGYVDMGGNFTAIDVPGASGTSAAGINNGGQIVGSFGDPTGGNSFLATPVPEPSSSLTLATGFVALFAMVYRGKRASSPKRTPI